MNTTTKMISGGLAIALISALTTLAVQKIHISFGESIAPATPPFAAESNPPASVTPPPVVQQVAQIISVSPHFETIKKPSRRCYPTQSTTYVQQQTNNNPPVAGALLGGLTGGLLASTARGRDRNLAIGGGAVLGAVAGGLIQQNMELQQQQYVPQVEHGTHCVSKMVSTQVQKGYDVVYLYNGQQGFTRMDKEPVVNSLIVPPVVSGASLALPVTQ